MSRSPVGNDGAGSPPRSPPGTNGPLTDEDVDEVVVYLLEKLNDYSEEINKLSADKESLEKDLKCLNRSLLKHTSKIKLSYGESYISDSIIDFLKLTRSIFALC